MCGFHCLYNATCLIRAVLADSYGECAAALSDLASSARFHSFYLSTLRKLIAVDNTYYVNKTDKKDLLRNGPLERNMLNYLSMYDPDLRAYREQSVQKGVKIFMASIGIGFGNLQACDE